MTAALKIDVDGLVTVLPDNDYATVRAALDGGWVELVPTRADLCLWADEDGKAKRLPRNPTAQRLWMVVDEHGCTAAGDFLVGPIVVTGGADSAGELSPTVPDWIVTALWIVGPE